LINFKKLIFSRHTQLKICGVDTLSQKVLIINKSLQMLRFRPNRTHVRQTRAAEHI